MFEGRVEPNDRLNLLYNEVTRHYHVIGKLTVTMAKGYVYKPCGKRCRRDVMYTCDLTNSIASSPCVATGVRIQYADCDRHIRSQILIANHRKRIGNKKAAVSASESV